ncbi:MAG: chemotaxis protein [Sulfuricurvum sp.]|uniref:chemotaxis protein n=1 Tax=Sulfuricurvum sp. TaxID=2025608 RepID=UPI002618753F|nr:chemotaxis protein [Sulfuricurvum sp.]MDD2828504.1 chemotaxis protein [Sulfuricurvum sp.]MDD4948965.1 chemotaxis protein [Sulfuricurvum sp.]
MKGQKEVLKVGTNEMELVDFRIFKQEGDEVYEGIYGINVAKVREIIRLPMLTELPGTPPFIEGIFDLRGVVIPVVNLAKWMGIEAPANIEQSSRVIITEFNNVLIGFVVHEAKRIRRINWKDIEPASFVDSSIDGSKITGVTRIEDESVLLILDLESVVQELGLYQPNQATMNSHHLHFDGYVLLLDDSHTARRIIKDAFEKMGFHVIEGSDGEQGLKILEDLYLAHGNDLPNKLRLIASDIEMPRMDGFHFAARVKDDARFKMIPIVFNSSISDHFSELRGKEAGAEAYLVKFDENIFYDEVARVVQAHIQ